MLAHTLAALPLDLSALPIRRNVFYANGNLCADWDPKREVLLRMA
jgi:hypothetical protein